MSIKMRNIVNDVNSSRICIDSYETGIPKGRLYHMSKEIPLTFIGWMSLLKQLNYLMDCNDFPQVGMQLRTFKINAISETSTNTCEERNDNIATTNEWIRGTLATFKLRIVYRQNATWQGILRWGERGKEEHFRSVLELMSLIDSCFINERYDVHEFENRSVSVV